jgi:hypothetical protein
VKLHRSHAVATQSLVECILSLICSRTIKHSESFIVHGSSLGLISQMNKSIKPLNNKQIGVLGLKSVVLEITDSCRRINLFSNVKYENFHRKFFQRFLQVFLMGF